MELQNIIFRLKAGDRVRLQGVKFYVEPDEVWFVKESGDRLFFKAVFTYTYGKKEQYLGEFSIYKEAILNGAIKMQKLQCAGGNKDEV